MFGGSALYETNSIYLSNQNVENQKAELQFLYDNFKSKKTNNLNWNFAFTSKNDMIFTIKNQTNFWENKTQIIENEEFHFPFSNINNWKYFYEL